MVCYLDCDARACKAARPRPTGLGVVAAGTPAAGATWGDCCGRATGTSATVCDVMPRPANTQCHCDKQLL